MLSPVPTRMDPDAFLRWCTTQDEKWELVDYVPTRMMTGASSRHDRIVVNAIVAFHGRLRGTGCTPTTADIALRTDEGNRRRPDMMVICEPPSTDRYETASPRLVLEVLSPSNGEIEEYLKLKEYEALESLEHILVADYRTPKVVVWTRDAARAWKVELIAGLDRELPLTGLSLNVPVGEIYDGLDFEDDIA